MKYLTPFFIIIFTAILFMSVYLRLGDVFNTFLGVIIIVFVILFIHERIIYD
jgi:hypothetical protein